MRLRHLALSCILMLSITSFGQNTQLTEEAEIAVMTLGPYQPELYSAFGHSAIRIYDPGNDIDWVFNYGVFDFDQENFYLNFAKGKMIYQLGLSYYDRFKKHYIRDDRDIREQYLNLTLAEKQRVFDFLVNNHKPENREYLYNYVYDNCASKIPEIIEEVFPNQIQYDASYMVEDKTIRDLMHDYLGYQPWGKWMIDIGLGMQIDKVANQKEFMFLPDYVFDAFKGATINKTSGTESLISRTDIVYQQKETPPPNGVLTPMNFFVLLFFVGGFITHLNMKKGIRSKWLDAILFGFSGVVGCWLVFLWFGTVHLSKNNLDILWAIPVHLPALFMMRIKKWNNLIRWYFRITATWYGLLLLTWAVLPEPLNMALVPFTLLLLLRSAYISYSLEKVKA